MLYIYQWLMTRSAGLLNQILKKRVKRGKEDSTRLDERRGISARVRPAGRLIWLHAASVGESQSALILINALLRHDPKLNILVTTVTQTSAGMMRDNLPKNAFHQFVPLDHPEWIARFLDHWKPDGALWIESELWPCTLAAIKARGIPAALINARLSDRSFRRWSWLGQSMHRILSCFDLILAQTHQDAERFRSFGHDAVIYSGNLKHSAAPLPHDEEALKLIAAKTHNRPICVYASTHKGEEAMVMRLHQIIANAHPEFLSIIIPRHPNRGEGIEALAQDMGLNAMRRAAGHALPTSETQIYIADTMGELGLFYRLSPIVYIGRSLSDDGGGGHNPIEAAQLNCAIIHGAYTQNLQEIYDDMADQDAAICVGDETALLDKLRMLLENPKNAIEYAEIALDFSNTQSHVIDNVLEYLHPILDTTDGTATQQLQNTRHSRNAG